MGNNLYFEISDGCLFISLISMDKRKLSLKGIIQSCNNLDHSIFSLEKINNGLSRLESEQYIELKNGCVYLTNKAKKFYKDNKKKFRGSIDEQLHYSNVLNSIPLVNNIIYIKYFDEIEYNAIITEF